MSIPQIPEFLQPDVCSESAALRILDLPTSKRDWLRSKLASTECGNSRIYCGTDILNLATELRATPPPAQRPIPTGLQHGAPTRKGQGLANRIEAGLETR